MNLVKEIKALQSEESYMYVDEVIEILEVPIIKEPWISGATRWDIVNSMVVQNDDQFYHITWLSPATEYQEGDPQAWTLTRVNPVQKTITDYEPVKEDT